MRTATSVNHSVTCPLRPRHLRATSDAPCFTPCSAEHEPSGYLEFQGKTAMERTNERISGFATQNHRQTTDLRHYVKYLKCVAPLTRSFEGLRVEMHFVSLSNRHMPCDERMRMHLSGDLRCKK
eukprot:5655725-Amphidinium_carterae.1